MVVVVLKVMVRVIVRDDDNRVWGGEVMMVMMTCAGRCPPGKTRCFA